MATISAIDDPAAAVAASQAALAATAGPSPERPKAPTPPDTVVDLPGGFYDILSGEILNVAEVRELNGEDEEALARVASNFGKYLDTILQRGTVKIGDRDVTKDLLDGILSADRDVLFLAIRRVTLGDEVVFQALCPECHEEQEATVLLSRDVKIDRLADPASDRRFEVTLANGKTASVALPDGHTHRALASATEQNEATFKTVLLSKCVESIGGVPVVSEQQVRALSIRDRKTILDEIEKRNPGPRLREVTRPCQACGADMALPLSLGGLFLL